MPWLDQELTANAGLDEEETMDLALLEGGDLELPTSAEIATGSEETRVPTGADLSEPVESDFGTETAVAAPSAASMIALSLVDDGGVQAGANVDRALWARAEPVIRAMAAKKGYDVVIGGSVGRNVRTMNEMSAFISDTSQTTA